MSPDEQLAFLNRFYAGDLGVKTEYADALRGALDQAPGAIDNARGLLAARR